MVTKIVTNRLFNLVLLKYSIYFIICFYSVVLGVLRIKPNLTDYTIIGILRSNRYCVSYRCCNEVADYNITTDIAQRGT